MKEYLVISNSVSFMRISSDDILCIQADGHYSTITHCVGGAHVQHVVCCGIGDVMGLILGQLKQTASDFIRVGRSLIINKNYIGIIDLNHGIVELWKDGVVSLEVTKESMKQLKMLLEDKDMYIEDRFQKSLLLDYIQINNERNSQ